MSGKKSGGRIRRRANSTSSSSEESDRENNENSKNKSTGTQRLTQSQNSSSQRPIRAELNEDDKKRLVADAVFYVLVQEQKRTVHKKGEILKVNCHFAEILNPIYHVFIYNRNRLMNQ